MDKKYLFFLKNEISLLKRKGNEEFLNLYTFKGLLEMLRDHWHNMTNQEKKDLGYD